MTEALSTYRNKMFGLVPRWLRGLRAFRVLYAIALVVDAMGDALIAAVKIRFQGLYSDESAPLLGAERAGMTQGKNETIASFCDRMRNWWDIGKHSGDFYTMAKEMAAYFLPSLVVINIISNNGTRYVLGVDGSWTVSTVSWNWDGDSTKWSRFWILIDNAYLSVTSTDHLILDAAADVLQPTRFVGSDSTVDAAELRRIMELRRPPHCHCEHIMPILDSTSFWNSPPNGTWKYWANRNNAALYWEGTTPQ
jgi:hypothetical protein